MPLCSLPHYCKLNISHVDGKQEIHVGNSKTNFEMHSPQTDNKDVASSTGDDQLKIPPTIAPITQPNYTFLRLGEGLIQPDILDYVDLHAAFDEKTNPRTTDLGTGKRRDRRDGVYLHWIIPRFYRSGIATTADTSTPDALAAEQNRRAQAGGYGDISQGGPATADTATPDFRTTPNRWMIIRRLHLDTVKPHTAVENKLVTEFSAWI